MINQNDVLATMGGVIKKDDLGNLFIAFGSTDINQNKIDYITTLKDIKGLLFYCCSFNEVDLSILSTVGIQNISVLHGSFGDRELNQLVDFTALKIIKLHDTKVSKSFLESLKVDKPNITFI